MYRKQDTMSLSINNEFVIDGTTSQVWDVMVDRFEHVSDWASGITSSGPNPAATTMVNGAPTGGRVCDVPGFGKLDERLVLHEPEQRRFAYTADAEKIPGFVQNLRNDWQLIPKGSQTLVKMRLSADVSGPLGAIMKPMMRRKFEKAVTGIAADLKAYVETGTVSPVKAKELAKAGR